MEKFAIGLFCLLLVQSEVIETPVDTNLKPNETPRSCEDNEIFIFDGERTLVLTHNKMARDINHIQVNVNFLLKKYIIDTKK